MFWLCQCCLHISFVDSLYPTRIVLWFKTHSNGKTLNMSSTHHKYYAHNKDIQNASVTWFHVSIIIRVYNSCSCRHLSVKVHPKFSICILVKHMHSKPLFNVNNTFINEDGARLNWPPLIYYSTAISHHCISIAVSVSMAASYVLCPACDMMDDVVVIGSHFSLDIILLEPRCCASILMKGQFELPMYHLSFRLIWNVQCDIFMISHK